MSPRRRRRRIVAPPSLDGLPDPARAEIAALRSQRQAMEARMRLRDLAAKLGAMRRST